MRKSQHRCAVGKSVKGAVGIGRCQIWWVSQTRGGMPGTIPKKRPDPSRRTKDCIRTSSIVRSFWRRGTGVGLREARGRLRLGTGG